MAHRIRPSDVQATVTASAPHREIVVRSLPRTRLMPPRYGAGIVARSRLVGRLEAADWPALALVTAPAGFGKTTLLCEWVAAAPFPAAWVAADHDDDLPTFVGCLLAAVARAVPSFALGSSRAALAMDGVGPDALADAVADDLVDLPDRLLVVVDDLDLIADPAVGRFLARLLGHPPPGCTLAVGSRAAAPLPIARLRGHGSVVEVGPADLRFTDEEALAVFAPEMPDVATLQRALALAQGWPCGVRLIAGAVRAAASPAAGLAAGAAQAADVMRSEVVRALPPEQRLALAAAAVADPAPPALVDRLGVELGVDDAMRVLRAVARATDLVSGVNGASPECRLHPLLAQAALVEVETPPGQDRTCWLHAAASAWFADAGRIPEAVAQALAAGDADGAAAIVEEAAPAALANEDANAVEGWLALLPPGKREERPGLWLAEARAACLRGSPLEAEGAVERAVARLTRTEPTNAAALGDAMALASIVSRERGDLVGALEAALSALDLLSGDGAYAAMRAAVLPDLAVAGALTDRAAEVEPVLAAALAAASGDGGAEDLAPLLAAGIAHALAGRFDDADAALRRLARLARRTQGCPVTAGRGMVWLGRVCYQRNRLDEAAACFAAALAPGAAVGDETRREAAMGAVLVSIARGRRAEAEPVLAMLAHHAATAGRDEPGGLLARSFGARVALLDGNLAAAVCWFAGDDAEAAPVPGLSIESPGLTRVRIRLALGGPQQAEPALRELQDVGARPDVRFVRERTVEAAALEALAHEAAGNADAAEQSVIRLLALAEPGRCIRAVLDAGPPIEGLLSRHPDRFGAGPFLAGLVEAARQTDARRDAAAARWQEPVDLPGGALSHREREVLGGLARRLTDKEIAQELRISPLTVKRHASNLYAKLGATGRRDAVQKARDLGFVLDDRPGLLSRTAGLR